jgi:hypothetical protein
MKCLFVISIEKIAIVLVHVHIYIIPFGYF